MIKRAKSHKPTATQEAFERASLGRKRKKHLFCLYIAGTTQRSLRAVRKIKELCERELKGIYALEIIDLYQQPARAILDQIVAAPTLVRNLPLPIRLVGDLTNDAKVLSLFKREGRSRKKIDGAQGV